MSVNALEITFVNFFFRYIFFRHFNFVLHQLWDQMHSGMCMEADLESVHSDLVWINSKLSGVCQIEELAVIPIAGW